MNKDDLKNQLYTSILERVTWSPMFDMADSFHEKFTKMVRIPPAPTVSSGLFGIFKKKPLQGSCLIKAETELAFQAIIGTVLVNLFERKEISQADHHAVLTNITKHIALNIRSYANNTGARWKDVEELMIQRVMQYAILMPPVQDEMYEACQESRMKISKTLLRILTNNPKSEFTANDLEKVEALTTDISNALMIWLFTGFSSIMTS